MEVTPLLDGPVSRGPRAYRRQIRALGPPAALLPALSAGLLAVVLLHNNDSVIRGVAGFLLAILAAPCMVLVGMPLATGTGVWIAALGGSAVVWLMVGSVAARRATRIPVATWRDYWREFAWIAAGLWLGTLGAFVVADVLLGRPFL